MHILIGLAAGVALLYFWLIGHWFARVLVAILFVPLIGIGGFAACSQIPSVTEAGMMAVATIGGGIGAILGWYLAGSPVYYWRWQLRRMVAAHLAPPPTAWQPPPALSWEQRRDAVVIGGLIVASVAGITIISALAAVQH